MDYISWVQTVAETVRRTGEPVSKTLKYNRDTGAETYVVREVRRNKKNMSTRRTGNEHVCAGLFDVKSVCNAETVFAAYMFLDICKQLQ